MDHEGICDRIRRANPDILLVSFGCPKQEKWISRNYQSLGVPVCIGVGATIDFLAGAVKRAPHWMQVAGLEWVFRLAQEPRRLLKRYATDFLVFATGSVREVFLNLVSFNDSRRA
jgi:N-acetylglucosaminyldiphosphoundecaprenol N-acetyl-beta-D-mannosaminyltransferase